MTLEELFKDLRLADIEEKKYEREFPDKCYTLYLENMLNENVLTITIEVHESLLPQLGITPK